MPQLHFGTAKINLPSFAPMKNIRLPFHNSNNSVILVLKLSTFSLIWHISHLFVRDSCLACFNYCNSFSCFNYCNSFSCFFFCQLVYVELINVSLSGKSLSNSSNFIFILHLRHIGSKLG